MPKYIRHSNIVSSLQNWKITFYCSLPMKNRHFLKNPISTMLFYFSNDFEKIIKFFYKKADCILRKKSQLLFLTFFEIQKFHKNFGFLELEKFQNRAPKSIIFGWKIDIQNRAPKIWFFWSKSSSKSSSKNHKILSNFLDFQNLKKYQILSLFWSIFGPFLMIFRQILMIFCKNCNFGQIWSKKYQNFPQISNFGQILRLLDWNPVQQTVAGLNFFQNYPKNAI